MKLTCCVCNREKEQAGGQVIELTDAEKEAIRKAGQEPRDSYFYCRPCYRMISDPEKAAQLVRGVVQVSLNAQGHPKAEDIANRYYQFFTRHGKGKS